MPAMSEKVQARLQKVFDQYDDSGSNVLTFDQFGRLMSSLGRKMTIAEVQDLVTRHAEEHPDHSPEDVNHVTFELFCYIVQSSRRKKLARKQTVQLRKEGLETFLERRRRIGLPDLAKGVDPSTLETLFAAYTQFLPPNHADMKPDLLCIHTKDALSIIVEKIDPTLTIERIQQIMKTKIEIKMRSKKWKNSKQRDMSFCDIINVVALGPEDKVVWAAKKMETNRATLKLFRAMDEDSSGLIEVKSELSKGLKSLTGAETTEDQALTLAARVHQDQKRRGVEHENNPNELDFSQFCLLIALINSEENGWATYVEERVKNNDTSHEDVIPMIPNRRQLYSFFTEMDGSRCGEISPKDLLGGLHKIGRSELTLDHVQEMFRHSFHGQKVVDEDGDGSFNFPGKVLRRVDYICLTHRIICFSLYDSFF